MTQVMLAHHCNGCPCHGYGSAHYPSCNLGSEIVYRETPDGELVEVSFGCVLTAIQTTIETISPSMIQIVAEND